jgi:hypothetical protein
LEVYKAAGCWLVELLQEDFVGLRPVNNKLYDVKDNITFEKRSKSQVEIQLTFNIHIPFRVLAVTCLHSKDISLCCTGQVEKTVSPRTDTARLRVVVTDGGFNTIY